jgi:hypothetical protein
MARLIAQPFDANRPLTVRRPFTASGRHYKPGDDFPWRTLRMSVRQAALLFNAGKLIHPAIKPVAAAPILTPAPTIEMEMQDEDAHHIAVTATAEDEQPAPSVEGDGLDDLTMTQLRAIAEQEGSPTRRSRDEQIEAIRQHRAG